MLRAPRSTVVTPVPKPHTTRKVWLHLRELCVSSCLRMLHRCLLSRKLSGAAGAPQACSAAVLLLLLLLLLLGLLPLVLLLGTVAQAAGGRHRSHCSSGGLQRLARGDEVLVVELDLEVEAVGLGGW